MAISTLDGALGGMQPPQAIAKAQLTTIIGRPVSYWATAGVPGAGSFDTTLNGVVLSSTSALVAGQIPHTDPGSGNSYLARFSALAESGGILLLCDRLWHNGGFTITSTTAQNITSPTWPARDNAGTTNGAGVLLGVEVSAAVGAGTPTLTAAYTNSAGTASRSATNLDATVASAAAATFFRIGLQAGDVGVKSVQSLTLSATWTSGTINLVAYRVLAALEMSASNAGYALDAITSGFPQLYNGVVPFLIFIASTATGSRISGSYVE